MTNHIAQELEHRWQLWRTLLATGGPTGVPPQRLRALGMYGGAQGVWVDKARTAPLTMDSDGVTIGVLHTGTAYADDLSVDGVLYHYPRTQRPPGRDRAEIQATKATGELGLPLFVITYPSPQATTRNVHLGWVEGWDDAAQLFLITFGEAPPPRLLPEAVETRPFTLVDTREPGTREVVARRGQQRFKFLVFQRYGLCCAVCDFNLTEALDAAHLRPKHARGSDDPRNGLVLCAVHHRAFDAGLFAIEPHTWRLHWRPGGPDAHALRLAHVNLTHLLRRPHQEALVWHWQHWCVAYAEIRLEGTSGQAGSAAGLRSPRHGRM
jgi:putative restriction endonuclease